MTPEERLDDQTPQQLVSEIQELSEQYRREVNTSRRTWPKSIRERALSLFRLGLNCHRISELTGIPEPTVSYWCKPGLRMSRGQKSARKTPIGQFLPVIQESQIPTVGSPCSQIGKDLGVESPVVSLPGGVTIRGLSVAQLIELCRGMGA